MNNFEKLQNHWRSQPQVAPSDTQFNELLKGVKEIEKKQKITNRVLCFTILVLVLYVFYVVGYNNTTFMIGVSIMIVSLLIRILIETNSLKRLRKLNVLENQNIFKQTLLNYYKGRKVVHYVITPIIFLAYAIGFIILLPLFKENLSHGFYLYILCSGVVLMFFFAFFIAKQINKELSELALLQED